MKEQIKLFFTLLIIILISSCSKDSDEIQTKNQIIELKFESNNQSAKNSSEQKTYTVEIVSISPLVIISEELEVIEILIPNSNEVSYAIVEKENILNRNASAKISECSGITRGYWYDGYDCFIYGTIITDSDCNRHFYPASAATQYLLNDCGWSNVA